MWKKTNTKTLLLKTVLSLPANDSILELSLSTINTTLFISAREAFISKAAKNDLMYARIFRAPNCYAFFKSKTCNCAFFFMLLKNITQKAAKLEQILGNCYSTVIKKSTG